MGILHRIAQRVHRHGLYATGKGINNSLTLKYDIRGVTSNTVTLEYDIRNLVANTKQLIYDIRNLISNNKQLVYDIRGISSNTVTLQYSIRPPLFLKKNFGDFIATDSIDLGDFIT